MTFTKGALTKLMGALAIASVATLIGSATASAGSTPTQPQRIVLLVPGQQPAPGTSSVDLFQDMADELAADGYTVDTVDVKGLDLYADSQAIQESVESAAAGVEVESLSLVAHSYGGLSSRHYLKVLGGSERIDDYIAIGTPQYGSPGGCVQLPGFGFDGCPVTPFIAELNNGDDTPGDVEYYSIRSNEELADGRLDGGQCRLAPIPNLEHAVEPADDRVIAAVSSALSGGCPGEFVNEREGEITLASTLFPAPR
ncbi:esterase/lipase family protein [Williamsia muralis]|uniref:Lipase n=1 Tax=Williamsia marianensis TaxID=85044 RepID=A0ABU4EWM6_WILMA|nr:lipase [Williamsia muralis]MDV7135141.1 lipase [Williamsia muralis]